MCCLLTVFGYDNCFHRFRWVQRQDVWWYVCWFQIATAGTPAMPRTGGRPGRAQQAGSRSRACRATYRMRYACLLSNIENLAVDVLLRFLKLETFFLPVDIHSISPPPCLSYLTIPGAGPLLWLAALPCQVSRISVHSQLQIPSGHEVVRLYCLHYLCFMDHYRVIKKMVIVIVHSGSPKQIPFSVTHCSMFRFLQFCQLWQADWWQPVRVRGLLENFRN